MKTTNLEKLEELLPRKGYISVDKRGGIHIRGVKREWLDETSKDEMSEWEVYEEITSGMWKGIKKYKCPSCGEKVGIYTSNYCPNCGKKLIGGHVFEEEEND